MANSTMEAESGIGKRYVPSRVASVSFLKTCSRCVVATWERMTVSILIDLIGKLRGRVIGRGGRGHLSHGPGTMTPCPRALVTPSEKTARTKRIIRFFKEFMISSMAVVAVIDPPGR